MQLQSPNTHYWPESYLFAHGRDANENLMLLLPGFGDTENNLFDAINAFQLPQIALMSLRAPRVSLLADIVKPQLLMPLQGLVAHCWYPLGVELGKTEILRCLDKSAAALRRLIDAMVEQRAFQRNNVFLVGFGQGAQVAMHYLLSVAATRAVAPLAGCFLFGSGALFQPDWYDWRQLSGEFVRQLPPITFAQPRGSTPVDTQRVEPHCVELRCAQLQSSAPAIANKADAKLFFTFVSKHMSMRNKALDAMIANNEVVPVTREKSTETPCDKDQQ